MRSIWVYILGGALLVALGFHLGRVTNDKVVVEYIAGATVHDTIKIEEPVYVEVPALPKLPTIKDTIYIDSLIFVTEKVDTAAIIQDYIVTRTYAFNVFDNDTLGKFDVKQRVGYNKLLAFDYIFSPIAKQITRIREPLVTPFVSVGYSTSNSVLLGGGLYYRHVGLEYNFNLGTTSIMGNKQNYHTFKLNYKF